MYIYVCVYIYIYIYMVHMCCTHYCYTALLLGIQVLERGHHQVQYFQQRQASGAGMELCYAVLCYALLCCAMLCVWCTMLCALPSSIVRIVLIRTRSLHAELKLTPHPSPPLTCLPAPLPSLVLTHSQRADYQDTKACCNSADYWVL